MKNASTKRAGLIAITCLLGLTGTAVCRADMAWQGFFMAPLDDENVRQQVQLFSSLDAEIKEDAARLKPMEDKLTALKVTHAALFPRVKGDAVKLPQWEDPKEIWSYFDAEYQPPEGYVLPVKYPHLVFVVALRQGDWKQYETFFVASGNMGGRMWCRVAVRRNFTRLSSI